MTDQGPDHPITVQRDDWLRLHRERDEAQARVAEYEARIRYEAGDLARANDRAEKAEAQVEQVHQVLANGAGLVEDTCEARCLEALRVLTGKGGSDD